MECKKILIAGLLLGISFLSNAGNPNKGMFYPRMYPGVNVSAEQKEEFLKIKKEFQNAIENNKDATLIYNKYLIERCLKTTAEKKPDGLQDELDRNSKEFQKCRKFLKDAHKVAVFDNMLREAREDQRVEEKKRNAAVEENCGFPA